MKTFTRAIALFAAVAGFVYAAAAPQNLPDAKSGADAGNRFAVELYANLAAGEGNLFLSPHSIHIALGMAYMCARGDTAAEMGRVLHLPAAGAEDLFRALIEALNTGSKIGTQEVYRLWTANSFWAQQGYPFQEAYKELVKTHFGGELVEVDYAKAAESARAKINAWVEERTVGKIRDLIPAGTLTPLTRLVLANAIYMKSAWDQKFTPELTAEAPFHTGATSTVKAQLMHRVGPYRYFEGDGFQAVSMPYSANRLAMVVLLPAKVGGLAALEKKLTAEALTGWLAGMKRRPVDLSLPRFKLTASCAVADALKALGMPTAFKSGPADFTGIADTKELYISHVLHKAYVDVNEEGTEAAAATAVVLAGRAMTEKEEPPVVFKADRPFLFLIRHEQTGAILFMGRVVDPTAGARS